MAGADLGDVGLEIGAVFVVGEVAASGAVVSEIVEGFVEAEADSAAVVMKVTGNGCLLCFMDII